MKERVVVTGLGSVSPIGNDIDIIWKNVKDGKNGIGEITRFNTENHITKLAAEVKDLDIENYISRQEARKLDLFVKYAIIASKKAFKDANIKDGDIDKDRLGIIIGSGIGGIDTIANNTNKLEKSGPDRVSPHFIPMSLVNLAAGNVAIALGAKGICNSVVTACAAGTDSIGVAFREIADKRQDIILCGGTEAAITPLGVAGFAVMKATTTSVDKNRASIPFDKKRSGFVMGEGSGIIVLESLSSAKKRGAKIYAEIVGYGVSCDAYHITAPMPDGSGASRAMQLAILDANIPKELIDYINAHGTSTPLNDSIETNAVKNTFGEHAYKLSMSSTKSMTGHLLGGSGGIEAIITIKALEDGFVPATIGYKEKDPDCDLNITPNEGKNKNLKHAMTNSFGFGGHNSSLIFKKWEE